MLAGLSRHPVVRFLGSLWFLLILLGAVLLILLAAHWLGGIDISIGSLRHDWYGAWWFNILMALLMVNLTVCTVIRTPWRNHWRWGFLITHSGILTLMIGSALTFNGKVYGDMRVRVGQSEETFTIERAFELAAQSADDAVEAFPLDFNPYKGLDRRRTFKLKGRPVFLHVEEILPSVHPDLTYVSHPDGKASVAQVALHQGKGRPQRLWLRDSETIGSRLLSLVYLSGPEQIFENLAGDAGPQGTLVLTLGGETRELDVQDNTGKPVSFPRAVVTILEHLPETGLEPRSLAQGVRFQVARDGGEPEEFYAFALEPDHSPMSVKAHGRGHRPDFQASLRISVPESIAVLCRVPSGHRYVFFSRKGGKASGSMDLRQRIQNPFMPPGQLEVELIQSFPTARAIPVEIEPKQGRPRFPALRLTVASGKESEERWIVWEQGPEFFRVGEEGVAVAFRGRKFEGLPFSLQLERFDVPVNPGTDAPRAFVSDVSLLDHETGEVRSTRIEVNTPAVHRGYVIYQASYEPDDPTVSIFQISWDPGIKPLLAGGLLAVSGTIFMFFLQPTLKRLVAVSARATDPPLTSAGGVVLLALSTLGTLGGALALLVRPDWNPLWVGFAIAGANLLMVFVLAGIARFWATRRPGRAGQAGQVMAAGWCINTAALVLLLWMKVQG